jgi:hypothetical protein
MAAHRVPHDRRQCELCKQVSGREWLPSWMRWYQMRALCAIYWYGAFRIHMGGNVAHGACTGASLQLALAHFPPVLRGAIVVEMRPYGVSRAIIRSPALSLGRFIWVESLRLGIGL